MIALLLLAARAGCAEVRFLDLQHTSVPPQPWVQAVKTGQPVLRRALLDGEAGICLVSQSSSFSMQRRAAVDIAHHPLLRLRWRVNALPPGADFRTPKDDQAAQFFVAFATPLRYRAINYIWDTTAPVGTVGDYDLLWFIKIKTLVVASGAGETGRWVTVTRDVAADYRALFGGEPPPVRGVRFQVNSQYTRSYAEGCIASVTFSPR
ncbi:MAG TPA: DUF3047 domain-containing protein [Thermoanaerobaculia bacterium]|nr:DUF3047 domain-containing protein [Thermoanaerobaculia bacterium]